MNTYLITGGAGFIGSHFVRRLHQVKEEARIVTVDKLTYSGRLENLGPVAGSKRHVFYKGDICDEAFMARIMDRHRPDVVVNFAAESHVDRSIEGSRPFVATNVEGVRVLLDQALRSGVSRFLQISTDEVYGPASSGAFREDAPLSPHNPYAATKAAGDLLTLAYGHTHGLPVMVTRSANNFGERQHGEKFIPKTISRILSLRPVPIYGNGRQIREWLYVEDHCEALERLLDAFDPGGIYNISSGIERENIEVARKILETIKRRLPASDPRKGEAGEALLTFVEDRKGHDFRYAVSWEKLRRRTGWGPRHGFSEALEKTVGWHMDEERKEEDPHEDSL